ncbi:hypothetical protein BDV38DRAFT_266943 [Aspergillus pseudotamarii]|uniref:NAD binding Rossmann fold oxidoreductase n=1 Tax=Aspergillus pseudotamarii TaxID=132259 RepID=A0A5N6TBX5_ASPPS|nr:uncharacterized protein BDV38DRAFT_266943 [Aspergillus pseudotamarii]KAE8143806.1 hypothetical protein BDV38DRAFT_266943 [Aspergillus pseudotamarii]
MPPNCWNVGIVGYGFSAKIFHIPFITQVPELKLYAIVQRTPRPDDDAEVGHPGVKSYRTAGDMMKDPAVEVVIITTAPDSHFALSKLAIQAGKHVVCEKPFTPTSLEADVLIALAKEHKTLLSVYHNRRWDADFVTLAKLIENGSLGRITEFETHFDYHFPNPPAPDAHKWRGKAMTGASGVYDLGVHLLDQAIQLFGLPSEVTGFIGSDREPNTSGFEDSFTVLLHYTNGMKVTAKGTVVSPEDDFKKFHLDIQEDQLKTGIMPSESTFGHEPSERYATLTSVQGFDPTTFTKKTIPTVDPPTYTEFYRRFVHALSGNGEVPVSGEDGRRAIHLVELAYESSRTRRTIALR